MNRPTNPCASANPEGIRWPVFSVGGRQSVRGILDALEHTQWLTPAALLENQLVQAASVLRHAYQTVPYYRGRLHEVGLDPAQKLTHDEFVKLPLLDRQEIQRDSRSLLSEQPIVSHGRCYDGKTSGSTGRPIHFRRNTLVACFWRAFTLRNHLWHQREFTGSFASIRALVQNDREYPTWGPTTAGFFKTGPSYSLDIRNDIGTQVRWLQDKKPTYLLTYPSNLRAIIEHCAKRDLTFAGLKQMCTISETLDPALPALCREVLGVPLIDCYGAEEVGYIALQCPQSDLYHIQSEHLWVEVLNPSDEPCRAGEAGRVVLTSLTNFAMPLIRYDIQDYAIAGPPCPCGRGLPTFTRVLGRTRNLLTLPDGRQYWPLFGFHQWMDIFPIEQMQLIQKSIDRIEVRYVARRLLTSEEQKKLTQLIQEALKHPFPLTLVPVDHIPRSDGGKFEDFISEISTARAN